MILVTRDCHGSHDIYKLYPLKRMELSYDDYLIILGDSGILWNKKNPEDLLGWYKKNIPCSVLFVDGNHENFDAINALPITDWNGGNVHVVNKQIKHLMRGQIFTIEDKSFFTFGGGYSVDKAYRTEGLSWWKEEMPTKEEYDIGIENLKNANNSVDYVLSHDCPGMFLEELITNSFKAEKNELNSYLDWVYENVEFKKYYCGHHHNDIIPANNLRCLFNDIVELR